MAVLISAIPSLASAKGPLSLYRGDFVSAKKVLRNGEAIVSVKLSKSGKAKLKKLNEAPGEASIHSEIAGVDSDLKMKEAIRGDKLEMGPYSAHDAQEIVAEINGK